MNLTLKKVKISSNKFTNILLKKMLVNI